MEYVGGLVASLVTRLAASSMSYYCSRQQPDGPGPGPRLRTSESEMENLMVPEKNFLSSALLSSCFSEEPCLQDQRSPNSTRNPLLLLGCLQAGGAQYRPQTLLRFCRVLAEDHSVACFPREGAGRRRCLASRKAQPFWTHRYDPLMLMLHDVQNRRGGTLQAESVDQLLQLFARWLSSKVARSPGHLGDTCPISADAG